MSHQMLPSKPFVPVGGRPNPSPQVIKFSTDGHGLSIVALKNMTVQVPGAADYPMQGSANPLINFRTIWPGYSDDKARSINGAGLSRADLAREVAKNVLRYLDFIRKNNISCAKDSPYAIMEQNVLMQSLYLEGIVNTSGNCWQPIIYVARAGYS